MKKLADFILEHKIVCEGGMSGHMAHPIDFSFFTANELKQLVIDIFSGKIEDVTEKIDGTNIQATMNEQGEVVFIRNLGDLNSPKGGMTIKDMAQKWGSRPSVADTFIKAGKVIQRVFDKIGPDFFNPEEGTRRVVNCECVNAGVTNIMPYASSRVSFHDIWVYKLMSGVWSNVDVTKQGLDVIEKACNGIDNAKLTPKVIIEITERSDELTEKYCSMIDDLFGRDDNLSIDSWKYKRFNDVIMDRYPWIAKDQTAMRALFDRWFNGNKKTNLRDLKKIYNDEITSLDELEKGVYKDVVSEIIEPLDTIFLQLGNDVIRLCAGLLNGSQNDRVLKQIQDDMRKVVKDVKSEGSSSSQAKLVKQLKRLEKLGGDQSINSCEGIVFKYKGKLMKLTGSFACLNRIVNVKGLR